MSAKQSNQTTTNSANKKSQEDVPPTKFQPEDHKPMDKAEELLPEYDDAKELHDQVATLDKNLKEAQAKAEQNWDALLRKEAELQNVIKRSGQEVSKAKQFALERFAKELLQVLDSLEQAINSEANQEQKSEVITGVELTYKMFLDILDKEGIKQINPENASFDPTFHEALSMQESSEVAPNTVLAVIQKGYTLQDRLIRPARVLVSKAPAE